MKIRVNGISKENKKVMVGRISEALGEKAVFLRAPSFAYQVGKVNISKACEIDGPDEAFPVIKALLDETPFEYVEIAEAQEQDAITEEQTEEPKCKEISASKQAVGMIMELLDGPSKAEALEILTNAENTKDAFGVRYAFFKEATGNSDDRKVKGFARYSSKTVDIDGIGYWITNDIYKRNLPKIAAWVESFK
ncbi:hypothetical protein [Anaerovibrio lipolyticus]|uniref:hypothetical protein n=1 Tax=Anaerovibrio lipolyticus TaxID=82374 RepID=UPI0023F3EC67|nr:hypothetical protein [Anaerovibrio lipolyticus]